MLMTGYPTHAVPVAQMQGPAIQGMFLQLLRDADPEVVARLHDDSRYRPYTLSPLGIGESTPNSSQKGNEFQGFQLPRYRSLKQGTPCYVRITLLEDDLFPTFSKYFLTRVEPAFRLGSTEFIVTNVMVTQDNGNPWSRYVSYANLIEKTKHDQRRITLQFLTPTGFRKGDLDLPLPIPRLVFQSYLKRFQEFQAFEFLPDFVELVDLHTGIANMKQMRTDTIKTKKVPLIGFTGDVRFEISKKAPADLVFQMNLLADFAFFGGTGRKTTVGMGQTVRIKN